MASKIAVLIPAAGHGSRFGGADNKLHATLAGRPIWRHSIDAFGNCPSVSRIIMAVSSSDQSRLRAEADADGLDVEFVLGGEQRSDSVAAMLQCLRGSAEAIDLVAIHDAARPLLQPSDRDEVFAVASRTGAAFLGSPVTSSIHRRIGDRTRSVRRDELFAAATPQVFALEIYQRALQRHRGRTVTDDVELVQRIGVDVAVVPGRLDNLKITYPEDLVIAEAIFADRQATNEATKS